MAVIFQCPSCQATHSVSERVVGRRVRCPACEEMVDVVPLPEGSPVAEIGPDDSPARPGSDDAGADRTGADRAASDRAATDLGRGTVMLAPPIESGGESGGDTVMLQAVDILPAAMQAVGPTSPPPPPKSPRRKAKAEEEEPPKEHFRRSRRVDTEMDMTPMVDVTFQLLIFFMITAAFALQKAKEIPRPQSDEPSPNVVVQEETALDRVTVKIDEFNTFLVINPDGDEEEAPSVQDLYIKLRRAKTGGSTGLVPTKLRVEAHGDSLHERVVAALDAGNETGYAELELATTPDDAD